MAALTLTNMDKPTYDKLDVGVVKEALYEAFRSELTSEMTSLGTTSTNQLPLTSSDTDLSVPTSDTTVLQDAYDIQILSYISNLCANLTIYSTSPNPNTPEGVTVESVDLWRYALAMTDPHEWKDCILTYISSLFTTPLPTDIIAHIPDLSNIDTENTLETKLAYFSHIAHNMRIQALGQVADAQKDEETDDTSLCNIDFSLAFGGMF